MFYFLEDHGIANYANDCTPYSAKTNIKLFIEEFSILLDSLRMVSN